jgi:hypothetical protein
MLAPVGDPATDPLFEVASATLDHLVQAATHSLWPGKPVIERASAASNAA